MWTEPRIEMLKAHCLTIMSAAEIMRNINEKTGAAFTRNAVIGKANRLGLLKDKPKNETRAAKQNAGRMANKVRTFTRVTKAGHGHQVRTCFEVVHDVSPIVDTTAPQSLDMGIFDLGEKHCRWPVSGDGWQTLFCGNDKQRGSSYCEYHHAVSCELRSPNPRASHDQGRHGITAQGWRVRESDKPTDRTGWPQGRALAREAAGGNRAAQREAERGLTDRKQVMNLAGHTYGRLFVLEFIGRRLQVGASGQSSTMWRCRCVCGTVTETSTGQLRSRKTISCGCAHRDAMRARNTKHGMANQMLEYGVWKAMRRRCRNPNSPDYKWYGERGIKVCARWNDFAKFIQDMGRRPSDGHSIDRIDVNGNYEPSNCRWATAVEQRHNRRDAA